MPVDAAVRARDHVGSVPLAQPLQERVRARGLPHELVHLARRSVAQQQAAPGDLEALLLRQARHPLAVRGVRVRQGVVVRELREAVVPGIRVSAPAIPAPAADGFVVVAAQHRDPGAAQDLGGAVGVGAEAAEVAQAPREVGAAPPQVAQRGGQRQVVAVDPAEQRDPGHVSHSRTSCRSHSRWRTRRAGARRVRAHARGGRPCGRRLRRPAAGTRTRRGS